MTVRDRLITRWVPVRVARALLTRDISNSRCVGQKAAIPAPSPDFQSDDVQNGVIFESESHENWLPSCDSGCGQSIMLPILSRTGGAEDQIKIPAM